MTDRENPAWIDELFKSRIYEKGYARVTGDSERAISEAEFIIGQLGLKETDRVLDLACGTGRHVILVAEKVNSVIGYDISPRLIDTAKSAAGEKGAGNVEFVVGDMRDLDYEDEFDAAFNFFTAWGYYSDDENFDVLKCVYHALKPGGKFLLEMINRDALMRKFQPQKWQELEDGTIVISEQKFDIRTGRMHARQIYIGKGEKKTIEIIHHIPSGDELVRMFQTAGFSNVGLVSSPDGGEAGIDTWRIAVIGAKPSTLI